MQISIKADIKKLTRGLNDIQKKQIPFATSRALNDVARQAASKTLRERADKVFEGGATSFTKSGFRYEKSNKKNLTAKVFIDPARAEYMKFQIAGGTRFPKNRALMIPTTHTRLNKFGNITRGTFNKLINDRSKYFSGIPKGMQGAANEGIWERYGRQTKARTGQKIRMVAKYRKRGQYQPKFPYADTVAGVVFGRKDGVAERFNIRLQAALRSKKR
jgi:hypothetical protein